MQAYLDALAQMRNEAGSQPLSIVLFGSAAKGGFEQQRSDVDLIVVVPDGTTQAQLRVVRQDVSRLEAAFGFKSEAATRNLLQRFATHASGDVFSCFVFTRDDLLSSDVSRIFGLNAVARIFIDRIVLANIVASAVTVWGEDLLPPLNPPAVRRLDVFKAYFAFTNQVLFCLAAYALLPNPTRYAMGALKRSLHSGSVCHHHTTTSLSDEVQFFEQRLGPNRTLRQLLALRQRPYESFGFVVQCLPLLARLHFRTALANKFPIERQR